MAGPQRWRSKTLGVESNPEGGVNNMAAKKKHKKHKKHAK